MPDNRSSEVQRFRQEQGATRIHLLTINMPFSPSQDRFVLTEMPHDAYLFECSKCSPRVTIGYGQLHIVKPETLRIFLSTVGEVEDAWNDDSHIVGQHDGITITVEVADSTGYRRARIIDPAPDSPQARLVLAWAAAFPQVRRAVQ